MDKDEIGYIEREHGYLLCYNDFHKIMLTMVTDKNRDLFVEISARLSHDLEIRKETGFTANKEMFKG